MDSGKNIVRRAQKTSHDERSGDDELGARISRLMRERGMTQPELARESGVSLTIVTRLLTGRRMTTFKNLDKIAAALGVSLDEFRCEENRPSNMQRDRDPNRADRDARKNDRASALGREIPRIRDERRKEWR